MVVFIIMYIMPNQANRFFDPEGIEKNSQVLKI